MPQELIVTYKGEHQVLQINDGDIIAFPDGIYGFSDWRRCVLIEDPEEAPLGVLQSIDDPGASLLITDPLHVFADYQVKLSAEEVSQMGLERMEDARVVCTLAIKEGPVLVTANLLAPIVINPRTRVARQVVLQDSSYSTQHPVLTVAAMQAEAAASGT